MDQFRSAENYISVGGGPHPLICIEVASLPPSFFIFFFDLIRWIETKTVSTGFAALFLHMTQTEFSKVNRGNIVLKLSTVESESDRTWGEMPSNNFEI